MIGLREPMVVLVAIRQPIRCGDEQRRARQPET
jgi:hypothetical protein